MPTTGTRIQDPDLKRLRAIKMLEAKVMRACTNAQIAKDFNVSSDTVARTLDWAKRAGLVATYEDKILELLVPAALQAFANALEDGDTQVALEVLKGTGLLKKQTDKPLVPAQALNEDDLAGYIRKIRGGTDAPRLTHRPILELVAAPLGETLPAAGASCVLEGQLAEDPDGAHSPAPPAPVCATGGEDCEADPVQQVDASADPAGLLDELALDS